MSPPDDVFARRWERLWLALVTLAGLVFLLVALGGWVYTQGPEGRASRAIARVLPFPAARVGGEWVSVREVWGIAGAGQSFEQALAARVRQVAMEQLARHSGVEVLPEHLSRAQASIVGNPDREGWSPRAFETRVLRPLALAYALEAWATQDTTAQREPRERAQLALARLEGGDAFASVAGDLSEDRSAIFGGDMGFLSLDELPEGWESALAALEAEERTNIIETSQAFVILRLLERVGEEEAEGVKLRISSIQIKKHPLERVLDDYLAGVAVQKYFD